MCALPVDSQAPNFASVCSRLTREYDGLHRRRVSPQTAPSPLLADSAPKYPARLRSLRAEPRLIPPA